MSTELDALAPRARAVAELFTDGMSLAEIAAQLRWTQPTIDNDLRAAMKGLGVPNRIRLAVRMTEIRLGGSCSCTREMDLPDEVFGGGDQRRAGRPPNPEESPAVLQGRWVQRGTVLRFVEDGGAA